jgi:alkaline phosphatase
MVEWDMDTDDPGADLRHVIERNDMIRQISAIVGKDTLIVFTADHSCLSVEDGHSGEEVLIAASGPVPSRSTASILTPAIRSDASCALGWRPAL